MNKASIVQSTLGSALLGLACVVLPVLVLAQDGGAQAATVSALDKGRGSTPEVRIRAKVVELDTSNRTVMLRTQRGQVLSVDVPVAVANLERVQVGDELLIHYSAAVAVALTPMAKNTGIREKVETLSSAKTGTADLPGTQAGRKVELLAVVKGVDPKARTITLRGVKRMLTVAVPEHVDLSPIKVGQEVRAVIVEAAAVNVEHRALSPAKATLKKPQ